MNTKNILAAGKRLGLRRSEINKIISEPTSLYKSGQQYGVVKPTEVYKSGNVYGVLKPTEIYKSGQQYGTISPKDF